MNIRRKISVTVIALGIMVTVMGSYPVSSEPVSATDTLIVEAAAMPIFVPDDVEITFSRSEVVTIAAPPKIVETLPVPAKYGIKTVEPVVAPKAPVRQISVPASPTPAAISSPASREVYVGLAGGQDVVDLGRGPVLFLCLLDSRRMWQSMTSLVGGHGLAHLALGWR